MADSYLTPPTTVSSLESARRLSRRRTQNDSSEESTATVSSTLSVQGFTAERYRVGAPPLQLLPLVNTDVSPTIPEKIAFERLLPTIRNILASRNIHPGVEDIDMYHRNVTGEPELGSDDLTILINAHWTDDASDSWLFAVDEIRDLLISNDVMKDVKVEIISWQLTTQRAINVIKADDPLVAAWPNIKPVLFTILEENPKLSEGWRTIDVIRIGYYSAVEDGFGPFKPVISITVDWTLNPQDWLSAEQEINNLLENQGFPVMRVKFERGDFASAVGFEPLTPIKKPGQNDIIFTDYAQRIVIGSDFGPAKYFKSTPSNTRMNGPCATIGGYIVATTSGRPPLKLALTNYHAIRGAIDGFRCIDHPTDGIIVGSVPEGSELSKIDRRGMGPRWPTRCNMVLESPYRRKHNYTLVHYEREIAQMQVILQQMTIPTLPLEIQAEQRRLMEKKKFFDDGRNELGVPWLGSGFKLRTKTNARLDYALIEMNPDRLGNNKIPDRSAWPKADTAFTYAPATCGQLIKGIAPLKCGSDLDYVYKVGARTGPTAGSFSHIKSNVKMEHDKALGMGVSEEYAFIGRIEDHISLTGDSGSFLINARGQWLGLVFGGSKKTNVSEQSLTYVTDAQMVLDHMSQQFNGTYQFELARS